MTAWVTCALSSAGVTLRPERATSTAAPSATRWMCHANGTGCQAHTLPLITAGMGASTLSTRSSRVRGHKSCRAVVVMACSRGSCAGCVHWYAEYRDWRLYPCAADAYSSHVNRSYRGISFEFNSSVSPRVEPPVAHANTASCTGGKAQRHNHDDRITSTRPSCRNNKGKRTQPRREHTQPYIELLEDVWLGEQGQECGCEE